MVAVEVDRDFEELLRYIKEARGFDFTGYKRSSLQRRVQRRMLDVGTATFADYLAFLRTDPDEFTALFDTVLINVTRFFRDPDAWSYLEHHVLPALLERSRGGPVRAWVAGCASGEEAYTLAMLLARHLGLEAFRERVKIYATDVDEEALARGRAAVYSDRDVRGVPAGLLAEYFVTTGQQHAVRKEFRRSVIFGRNDLVRDAPISHVDLLLSRNTLMYFTAETQARVLERFNFALNPQGVLFLGKAELLLGHPTLFAPLDLKRRFFVRVDAGSARYRSGLLGAAAEPPATALEQRLRAEALAASPLAQLVVGADGRLALANHRAESLCNLAPRDVGRPFQDLEISFRPVDLRDPLREALSERRPHWLRAVERPRAVSGEEPAVYDVQVTPLLERNGTLLGASVVFFDVTRYHALQQELEYANRQLELAYEELQSTNQELETTNEELQSTNEELETTNEELQSTNQELETLNAELQSMNDELQSMNDELQSTNQQLRLDGADVGGLDRLLDSVLTGLHAAVAVVDRDLVVTAWNARAEQLWGVRAQEAVGLDLANLDIGLPVHELASALHAVRHSRKLRVEAVTRRGQLVAVQVVINPLTDPEGRVTGAVLVMGHARVPSLTVAGPEEDAAVLG